MKFLPTVPPMAEMSPTCSIMVANAIGTMVITEVRTMPQSVSPFVNTDNPVFCQMIGRPNQSASLTSVKSTLLLTAATA